MHFSLSEIHLLFPYYKISVLIKQLRCPLHNTEEQLSNYGTYYFVVSVPAFITTPPEDAAVAAGSSAAFTCAAEGIPPPTITWFRGDVKVEEGPVLTLQDVGGADGGTYTCRASNDVGEAATASAQLAVFGKGSTRPHTQLYSGSFSTSGHMTAEPLNKKDTLESRS